MFMDQATVQNLLKTKPDRHGFYITDFKLTMLMLAESLILTVCVGVLMVGLLFRGCVPQQRQKPPFSEGRLLC